MLTPGDLLTDAMLLALDSKLTVEFGEAVTDRLAEVRRVAVADWLAPRLETAGYPADRHRTRRAAETVYGLTGSAYTAYTGTTVPAATVYATPASDALYVAYRAPYAAIWLGLADHVSAVASVLSAAAWDGTRWAALAAVVDGTQATAGVTLSGGGRVSWQSPDDWPARLVNGVSGHWLRLTVSATPTAGTVIDVLQPIVRSRLSYPLSLFALSLLYRDAAATRRGTWLDQATSYAEMASEAIELAMPLVGDEFDLTGDDVAGLGDSNVATDGPRPHAWSLERG